MTRARTATGSEPAATEPAAATDLDAFEARLAARLDAFEARLAAIESAHRSGAAHARHLDAARESVEAAARAAVERAREQAKAARSARDRELAGDRVRLRAIREVDAWIGPRGEKLRLSPGNVRANVAKIMDRGAWLAIVERSDEVRAAIDSGALVVEGVAPDEAARIEARS